MASSELHVCPFGGTSTMIRPIRGLVPLEVVSDVEMPLQATESPVLEPEEPVSLNPHHCRQLCHEHRVVVRCDLVKCLIYEKDFCGRMSRTD